MALVVFYLVKQWLYKCDLYYLYKYCNFIIEVFSDADCNPTYMGDKKKKIIPNLKYAPFD